MIAKLLKTAAGAPVLSIEVKLSCQNGEAVEYRLTYVHLGLLKFYSNLGITPLSETCRNVKTRHRSIKQHLNLVGVLDYLRCHFAAFLGQFQHRGVSDQDVRCETFNAF